MQKRRQEASVVGSIVMSAEPERFVCLAMHCAARAEDCVLLYKPGYAVRTTRRKYPVCLRIQLYISVS